ncbi:MAG: hypothetical protein L0G36_10925, partial [Brevibacterium sp.]|nr:hypothetical protein [Brevibacterium sp.]
MHQFLGDSSELVISGPSAVADDVSSSAVVSPVADPSAVVSPVADSPADVPSADAGVVSAVDAE